MKLSDSSHPQQLRDMALLDARTITAESGTFTYTLSPRDMIYISSERTVQFGSLKEIKYPGS